MIYLPEEKILGLKNEELGERVIWVLKKTLLDLDKNLRLEGEELYLNSGRTVKNTPIEFAFSMNGAIGYGMDFVNAIEEWKGFENAKDIFLNQSRKYHGSI